MLLKAAIPFNFSSPKYLSHHRTRKNRYSPVSRASPAHMNSPYDRYLGKLGKLATGKQKVSEKKITSTYVFHLKYELISDAFKHAAG